MKRWICGLVLLLASAQTASAAGVTDKDVQAIANSLKYIHGLHQEGGALTIAVIYDPSVADSLEDGDRFITRLAALPSAKNGLTLKGQLVSVRELPTRTGISIAYIASGLSESYGNIGAIAAKRHLFTVGREQACVTSGCCILAVETAGAVNIYLNEQAMRASGFDVDAAFKFMVKSV